MAPPACRTTSCRWGGGFRRITASRQVGGGATLGTPGPSSRRCVPAPAAVSETAAWTCPLAVCARPLTPAHAGCRSVRDTSCSLSLTRRVTLGSPPMLSRGCCAGSGQGGRPCPRTVSSPSRSRQRPPQRRLSSWWSMPRCAASWGTRPNGLPGPCSTRLPGRPLRQGSLGVTGGGGAFLRLLCEGSGWPAPPACTCTLSAPGLYDGRHRQCCPRPASTCVPLPPRPFPSAGCLPRRPSSCLIRRPCPSTLPPSRVRFTPAR